MGREEDLEEAKERLIQIELNTIKDLKELGFLRESGGKTIHTGKELGHEFLSSPQKVIIENLIKRGVLTKEGKVIKLSKFGIKNHHEKPLPKFRPRRP